MLRFHFFFFLVCLLKVYKSIFTSPSSAADVVDNSELESENEPPSKAAKLSRSRKKATKHNMASKLNMNDKVTPQSITYAAVQVLFDLIHFIRIPTYIYLYSSFTSICRLLSDGMKFTEDSITVVFITTLLTFLKICKRALRRDTHKIYISGGLCKSSFHDLEQLSIYVCLVEKSSQMLLLTITPAQLLLGRLWRNSVPLVADADLDPKHLFISQLLNRPHVW